MWPRGWYASLFDRQVIPLDDANLDERPRGLALARVLSLRCPSSIDEDAGAVHERGGRRGENEHGGSLADGPADSRDRDASDHLFDELGPIELLHVHSRANDAKRRCA